ncbi:MAG: YggT family protein [Chloroflexi bacterium]|nr:YggT family protein [Chloroflexota bacterium]MCL5026949.1 YggT family protein [Chloroflexota bacterium]
MISVFVQFIELLFNILTFAILARVLLSWFPTSPNNKITAILYDVTEPILGPIRKMIPPIGMLDLSAFIAIIALQVLEYIILSGVRMY